MKINVRKQRPNEQQSVWVEYTMTLSECSATVNFSITLLFIQNELTALDNTKHNFN